MRPEATFDASQRLLLPCMVYKPAIESCICQGSLEATSVCVASGNTLSRLMTVVMLAALCRCNRHGVESEPSESRWHAPWRDGWRDDASPDCGIPQPCRLCSPPAPRSSPHLSAGATPDALRMKDFYQRTFWLGSATNHASSKVVLTAQDRVHLCQDSCILTLQLWCSQDLVGLALRTSHRP